MVVVFIRFYLIGLIICFPFFQKRILNAQQSADTTTITIRAIAGMQYDPVRFSVPPGQCVKLILINADEMDHNLIIGKKQSRQKIVDAALALGSMGMANDYVPEIPDILWHIPIIHGGQKDSIIFFAPRSTGIYPYVCTFPGHGNIMYGAMHVTHGMMPALSGDSEIPPHRRDQDEDRPIAHDSGHPFPLDPPFHYRVLMPEAGPAAIAVALPNQLSYCWDAGACRLRYVWSGAFLDMQDYWKVKGELHAKILGKIIYRDSSIYPLLIGVDRVIPKVKFKGYRLVEKYPEFHYQIQGMDVFEKITSTPDGSGLIRRFQIKGATEEIFFVVQPVQGISYYSDKGIWEKNQLRLTPKEAEDFTVNMILK